MKNVICLAAVCSLLIALGNSAVVALEEQRAPAPPSAANSDAPKADVQDGAAVPKPDGGTEIRIPGLGKLGTLPKMDFGLELLYGAAENKPAADAVPSQIDEPEDLTIRGSVKHRF